MKLGKLLTGILILLLIVEISSCGKQESRTIKIGVLLPLTGSQANFGEMEKNSYEMYREKVNAEGGIKGKKLELLEHTNLINCIKELDDWIMKLKEVY